VTRTRLGLLLITAASVLLCLGCPTRGAGDDDDATDDDDAVELPVVPDPGDAQDDWALEVWDEACCSTPETAYPVGTVTRDAGYIQGFFDSTLSFFYVFRTNTGMAQFTFPDWFEDVHLHEGDGLRFGAEIEPASSTDSSVTWDVEEDHVYVLELASEFEGFF